jgi:hypothetical protein
MAMKKSFLIGVMSFFGAVNQCIVALFTDEFNKLSDKKNACLEYSLCGILSLEIFLIKDLNRTELVHTLCASSSVITCCERHSSAKAST